MTSGTSYYTLPRSLSLTLRALPRFTSFPYTTLFRSAIEIVHRHDVRAGIEQLEDRGDRGHAGRERHDPRAARSEEHTFELQSPGHLVCRLLVVKEYRHLVVPGGALVLHWHPAGVYSI